MAKDDELAENIISGKLKRSKSYHQDYGRKTYREITDLANGDPPDTKARQMKKLIEQAERLLGKLRGKRK